MMSSFPQVVRLPRDLVVRLWAMDCHQLWLERQAASCRRGWEEEMAGMMAIEEDRGRVDGARRHYVAAMEEQEEEEEKRGRREGVTSLLISRKGIGAKRRPLRPPPPLPAPPRPLREPLRTPLELSLQLWRLERQLQALRDEEKGGEQEEQEEEDWRGEIHGSSWKKPRPMQSERARGLVDEGKLAEERRRVAAMADERPASSSTTSKVG